MALWCRTLPTVTVRKGEQAKAVTFIYPYYQNAGFLREQIAVWESYPEDIRSRLSVILVDDGSPEPMTLPSVMPIRTRAFRIDVDVRWNWLAARNIGAHYADNGWILLTDMDHVVPAETASGLIYGDHCHTIVYAFSRREHHGAAATPHSASFFMTRRMFWTIGGYDEALSGHYGTDGEFRRRVAAQAHLSVLTDPLIRYEFVGDSSTTRYQRKQPQDAAVRALVNARRRDWKPKTLSFPFHEVTS